jgi:hypothetical protein
VEQRLTHMVDDKGFIIRIKGRSKRVVDNLLSDTKAAKVTLQDGNESM